METHSSVLAWRIPGTGEPGGLLSMGLHRVGHDWSDLAAYLFSFFKRFSYPHSYVLVPYTTPCFRLSQGCNCLHTWPLLPLTADISSQYVHAFNSSWNSTSVLSIHYWFQRDEKQFAFPDLMYVYRILALNGTLEVGLWGFPGGSSVEESTCQCRRHEFDPWVGKIPWRQKWCPTPVFLPEKSHGQRNLAGYSLWGGRIRYHWPQHSTEEILANQLILENKNVEAQTS